MIRLFCDMGADISKEIADKYNIGIFTMMVSDGNSEYVLGKDIDKYKLFDNMAKGTNYSTSQVSYKDFFDVFKNEIEKGNEIVYISLSSGLSGTFNTATIVKNSLLEEYPDAKIHVVDSLGASLGYGLMVIKSAKMIEEGKSIDEILDFLTFSQKHIKYLFSLDDLTYLYRGGRLSKTKFFVGSLLNINPILNISRTDGTLSMIDKVRGIKALKKKLLELLQKDSDCLKGQSILILHGDCENKANELKDYLSTELNHTDIKIMGLDAVIGCHTGPSVVAVVYLDRLYGEYDFFEV